MSDLKTDELESIQHLLLDPLRETVRTEIQLSHNRLTAAVQKVDARLAGHIDRTERRISTVEIEIGRLRAFRHRIAAVYGAMAIALSLAWSMLRDKLVSKWTGR